MKRFSVFLEMFSLKKYQKLYVFMFVALFSLMVASSAHAILYTPWYDVQKYAYGHPPGTPIASSIDPDDTTDSLMCWAAASSNILMYTGWGFDRDLDGTIELYDDIYHEYLWSFPDERGNGTKAFSHYIGAYYPSVTWSDYFRQENATDQILRSVEAWLADGYGIYLSVDGHAITCWGFEKDELGNYTQIHVTDSDDSLDGNYTTYDLSFHDDKWWIDDYWADYIHRVDAFGPRPVPEPCTLVLLGSGIIGLAVFGRKKFGRG